MRPRTMTAHRIIARSGTELDTVRLAAADAAWQMPTISGNMPETLAPVTLQHAVRRLWHARCLQRIAPVVRWRTSRKYTGGIRGTYSAATPATFRNGIEACYFKEVQTLTQQCFVMICIKDLSDIVIWINFNECSIIITVMLEAIIFYQ